MNDRHRVLIVEDDQPTAEGLGEIVKAAECEHIIVDDANTALELLREQRFCLILLDLEIKGDAQAIRGHVAHGASLLRKIRQLDGTRSGSTWWLPILVISGFARERDEAVQVMKDGATDIIQKPFTARTVTDSIRNELTHCGRHTHADCLRGQPRLTTPADGDVVIAIPGDREGRRTRVFVNHKALLLPDSELKHLLQLLAAHGEGRGVHKRELGAKTDQGFKGIARLTATLRPALPDGFKLITNDQHGTYALRGVSVIECNATQLAAIGDRAITSLAQTIADRIGRRPSMPNHPWRSDGKR